MAAIPNKAAPNTGISSSKVFPNNIPADLPAGANGSPQPDTSRRDSALSKSELINLGDSLKRGSQNGHKHPSGFATIKTTQAIVTEEQTQREQQDVIEFQNLKRQHMKQLKALENKLRAELDELKQRSEKEYNQAVQQFTKELDSVAVRHGKELEERQRYSQNEEKKFVTQGKETNAKELKQYQGELNGEYKRAKEELKRELAASGKAVSGREKEERLKAGKEQLHCEGRLKAENRRKRLELTLTGDVCRLKRKHMVMFHKLEYELLLNVRENE